MFNLHQEEVAEHQFRLEEKLWSASYREIPVEFWACLTPSQLQAFHAFPQEIFNMLHRALGDLIE